MTISEFLIGMKEVLQSEHELNLDDDLSDIDEWDSLSIMATMAFLESNFNIRSSINDFYSMKTISDIAKFAGL